MRDRQHVGRRAHPTSANDWGDLTAALLRRNDPGRVRCHMPRPTLTVCVFFLASVIVLAQRAERQELVDIELMTYPEIYSAIHDHGKTTVLVYNGGTEQRGPH